jgi:S-methylmethionine-dependent homocysteine/selenocysteine methylase
MIKETQQSNTFCPTISSAPFIITEGSLIERLRRDPAIELDPYILHAGFIYESHAKEEMTNLYRGYLDIGKHNNLPIMTYTPTWRATNERINQSNYKNNDVNGDGFQFVDKIRQQYGPYAKKIFIGGLMGCKGDAYKPEEGLSKEEAISFHRVQVEALAKAGVDFLIAQTMPAHEEALGMAEAMAKSKRPYIISFIVQENGDLLDGTPLPNIIDRIDEHVSPAPCVYMINCVHPSRFESAMGKVFLQSQSIKKRLLGLQANTSCKSPEELDGLDYLDSEAPGTFASAMIDLYQKFGTKILGGCCGSDNSHIEAIARKMIN